MAASFHATASTSYLYSGSGVLPAPLSCATKVFLGSNPQSRVSLGIAKPNSRSAFHTEVHKSIQPWTIGSKPTQGCIKMFFETPVVSLTAPGQKSRQWMDVWTALNRKRIVFITGYIYDELSNDIMSTMLYLDTSGSDQPILFIINSIGGEVNASLTIYDTMQTLKSPVGTRCVGLAENMAGFLLAAGDKGSRAALPYSNICLEPLSGTAFGQADDVCVEADEISRVTNYICSQLATKTGQPVDKIHKDLEDVMNFSAQEALEYGLIDRIVRPPRLTPNPSKKGTWSLLNF